MTKTHRTINSVLCAMHQHILLRTNTLSHSIFIRAKTCWFNQISHAILHSEPHSHRHSLECIACININSMNWYKNVLFHTVNATPQERILKAFVLQSFNRKTNERITYKTKNASIDNTLELYICSKQMHIFRRTLHNSTRHLTTLCAHAAA